MILGIDASNVRAGGGITHLNEILTAAKPEVSGFTVVIIWASRNTLDQLPVRPWLKRISPRDLNGSLIRRALWQQVELKRLLDANNCDLLFVPGGHYLGRFRPFVTMSQNLLPFQPKERRRFGWSLKTFRLWLLGMTQTATFRRGAGVIFLSDAARKVVLLRTGSLRGIVRVIPHGISDRYRKPPRQQREIESYSLERPYKLLYVSNIAPYKHQLELVEAVARLRRLGLPVTLDLIGPARPSDLRPFLAKAERVDPSGSFIRYHGEAAPSQLHECYQNADGFVFASTCETISITLLEAMASGLPIACSDRAPMPEVLGEGGIYFDAENVVSIEDTLTRFLLNRGLREESARRSHERAADFSWSKSANTTFELLASISRASSGNASR